MWKCKHCNGTSFIEIYNDGSRKFNKYNKDGTPDLDTLVYDKPDFTIQCENCGTTLFELDELAYWEEEVKTIFVRKDCKISQEDFASCMKGMRETAINVTSKDICDESGFINFMLAISNTQDCCEHFGAKLVWVKEPKDEYYIDHIKLNSNSNNFNLTDEDNEKLSKEDCIVCSLYDENNELICYAYVFNVHNGYYAHNVFINNNFNTEVTYL